MRTSSSCQTSEVGVEYEGPELDIRWNVSSVELCASECEAEPECKVWTYIGTSLACFLKSSRVIDVPRRNATSGECLTKGSHIGHSLLKRTIPQRQLKLSYWLGSYRLASLVTPIIARPGATRWRGIGRGEHIS